MGFWLAVQHAGDTKIERGKSKVCKYTLYYYQPHGIPYVDTSFEALFPGIAKALGKVQNRPKTTKKKDRNDEASNPPPATATSPRQAHAPSPTFHAAEFDSTNAYDDSPSMYNMVPSPPAMELLAPFDGYHLAEEEEESDEEIHEEDKGDDQVVVDWNPAHEEEEHERERAMMDDAVHEAEMELEREMEMLLSDGGSNKSTSL